MFPNAAVNRKLIRLIRRRKMSCSFSLLVGGECGCDPRSRIPSCGILPLVSCNKSVSSHKKLLKFSGCETEVELILARSACFQTPLNIQEMTICPLHRERLGIGWRRSITLCSVPQRLSDHSKDSQKLAERGCTLAQSKFIFETTGEFIPVGSGKYTACVSNFLILSIVYITDSKTKYNIRNDSLKVLLNCQTSVEGCDLNAPRPNPLIFSCH